jgi:hypothetical protein
MYIRLLVWKKQMFEKNIAGFGTHIRGTCGEKSIRLTIPY